MRPVSLITINGSARGVKPLAYLCRSFDCVEHQPLPQGPDEAVGVGYLRPRWDLIGVLVKGS